MTVTSDRNHPMPFRLLPPMVATAFTACRPKGQARGNGLSGKGDGMPSRRSSLNPGNSRRRGKRLVWG